MHTITINDSTHPLDRDLVSWVSLQFRRARQLGQSITLRISLGDDIALTYQCPPSGGGGVASTLSPTRQRIVRFFQQNDLCGEPLNPGRVIAFLKRLRKLL